MAGGKEYKAIISIAGKLDPSLGSAVSSAIKMTGGIGSALKVAGTVAGVGAAAIGVATTAVAAFGKSSVEAGMNFDSSMSQVAATMGTTVDQIGDLRNFALEMGRTTAFSATESADALNYMALAGYDAETSMKMLPNVLNLAAAGNMDLARASDMVTDTQTAFGMSIDRTSQMVDEMAKAASTGNTSVEQLGDAFLTVGGLAQELNGGMVMLSDGTYKQVDGIQELEIALTGMANAGIKGTEAGTHMRNMLLKLSSPTSEGVKQLEALGVSVFDAQGNMRSLDKIFQDLSGSLGDLTQEQKLQAISELFNARDIASAEALLNSINQDWDKIGESILNADGAAEQMANTQLDNLAGDVKLFKSALEGAQIAISDTLSPSLREFVQFGTDGISRLTSAFQEGGLSGAMEELGTILTEGLAKLIENAPSLVNAGMKLLMALTQGIIQNMPQLITTGIQIATMLIQGAIQALPQLASSLATAIVQTISSTISPEAGSIVQQLFDIFSQFGEQLAPIFQQVGSMFMELGPQIAEGIMPIIQSVMDMLPPILELIGAIIEAIVPIGEVVMSVIPQIIDMIGQVMAALSPIVQYLTGELTSTIQQVMPFITNMLAQLMPLIMQLISGLLPVVIQLLSTLMPILQAIFQILGPLLQLVTTIVSAVLPMISTGIQMVISLITALTTYLNGPMIAAISGAVEIVGTVIAAILNHIQLLLDFVTNVFTGQWSAAWENVKQIFANVFNALAGIAKAAFNAVIAIINAAIDGINSISVDIPAYVPVVGGQHFGLNIAKLPMLAHGGFTNGLSIAGEAGQEAVISFDPSARQQNLSYWARAGKLLGVNAKAVDTIASSAKTSGSNAGNFITFSPNVTIQGNADYDTVLQALRDNEEEFMDMMNEFFARKESVSYG